MTAEVMDQLCGVALCLHSGSLQRSIFICYGEVNKYLLLGRKFCLEGFAGLLLHEMKI